MQGAGPSSVQGGRSPAQGAGPSAPVRPLAPTTIPQLDGAEPYFGPQNESKQCIIELDEAGTYLESELDREEFYEAFKDDPL